MLSTVFYIGLAVIFFAAVVPLLSVKGGRGIRVVSFISLAVGTVLLLAASSVSFYVNQKLSLPFYDLLPGLGFSFYIDRLSAFFVAVLSVVSFAVAVYSFDYVEHGGSNVKKKILAGLMSLFILSMILVVSSANTFSFLFFWELMSLTSLFLVMHDYEKKETRKAGIFYFIMTQLSTVFLILGFLALYQVNGSFNIEKIASSDGVVLSLIFLALFTGFAIKAGVIPFHKWLPYAHAASPSNISALMSGVMLKVAIYGIMRFTLFVLVPAVGWWGPLILVAGTISAILGVIYALKEHDIKRLLAYHSIENIGIILIGYGAYMVFSANGLPALAMLCLAGALFHTLNHAVFKSLLFMSAGSVVQKTGERNIEEMGGLIKRMPHTALLFLIGAVSISALPPLNGFVSEYMIFTALLQSYDISNPFLKVLLLLCLAIFALTSALASACFVKAFGTTFLAIPRSERARDAKEVERSMLLGPAILAVLCIGLGVFSSQLFASLGFALPLPNLLLIGVFLLAAYAAVWAIIYYGYPGKTRTSATWDCGTPLNSRTEYTASGFSQPIVRMFKSIYRTQEVPQRVYYDKYGILFKEGRAEIHLLKFFEEDLYTPIARKVMQLSSKVSRMQNWNLDTYIAYVFVAVLLVMLYVGWFI